MTFTTRLFTIAALIGVMGGTASFWAQGGLDTTTQAQVVETRTF